jgi:MYXO-CTERM domain-containing protein
MERKSFVKKTFLFGGLVAVLLGGLWLLQGLGIVHLQPILCFADCVPVQGPSTTWAVIGGALLAAGVAAVLWSLRRRHG